ncbi:hypothetical protein SAMN05421780_11050 [Flexibacter flexilis DSM 6793]|uniref:Uncharacterized protein n=1 Tax=Flexibacter flexilis DSM 6793 TaxID=927664 RepID=A0A1I1M7D4_9BACT|nr:hypothetical protein [Flexibacter flexilis]SFC80956.1 hypothetical protein SAMN05421780_11050 [Flexibacter flexilis DSM 6793]
MPKDNKKGKSGGTATKRMKATDTAYHVGAGAAGVLVGAAVGRYALGLGLVASVAAWYFNEPMLATAGVGAIGSGVMAAGANDKPVTDGSFKEEAKANLKQLTSGAGQSVFIDKYAPSAAEKLGIGSGAAARAAAAASVNGLGRLPYNTYLPSTPTVVPTTIPTTPEQAQQWLAANNYDSKPMNGMPVTMGKLPTTMGGMPVTMGSPKRKFKNIG